jgi:hypothetical protein
MKAATEERWQGHVTAWAASGRTCKEYAAKAGINPRTLTWWKSKLKEAAAPGDEARFVEVTDQVAPSSMVDDGVIEVEVGDIRIVVRGRVDAEALARVLAAVEARR